MKKFIKNLIFGLTFFGFTITAKAQLYTRTGGATQILANVPNTNTNVGVGTNTPKSKFDVEGGVSIGVNYSGTTGSPVNGAIIEGNVGIGTTTPTTKLDVNGEIKGTKASFPSALPNGTTFASALDQQIKSNILSAGTIVDANGSKTFNFIDCPSSTFYADPWFWFSLQSRNDTARFVVNASQNGYVNLRVLNKIEQDVFKVTEDGNDNVSLTMPKSNSFVGIGTTSATDGVDTFKLSVAGNIRANRVKVYTTWADFVFEKNYKLASLKEVEEHIQTNGHLKDIPSATVVEKSGIELGEMNKLLLQKIEELTLYVIQINKELQVVKSQIKKD